MPALNDPVLLPTGSGRGFGGGVFLGLFGVLSLMACLKYLALHSTVFDLGVFLSNIYSLHNDGQWWRAFLGHAQPLLPVYAQVYRLVPDQAAPLVLLTGQAFVLALPALWAARRYGMLAALAYALYFPVWTNALFDFHLDHLLIPLLFGFLAAATSGRYRLAVALGLLPALVKEPYALTTAFCGLYLLVAARQSRAGWGLILFGGLYFFVATAWLVPFCTAEGGFGAPSGAYAWLGSGPGAAVLTLLTHPLDALAVVFGVPGKWKYLAFLFGALLFFPIFRPKLLLPALPALALALFSTQPSAYGWANHYTAGAAGALFFAFCEVLGPVRILARQSGNGVRRFGLLIFLALAGGHVLLAPSPVSRLFWTTDNFAFSIDAYEPTARDAGILGEILRSVPRDPALPVVSQNTLNWGALAERRDFNSFPLGVFDAHPVRDLTGATWKDFWAFIRTGQTLDLPVRTWQAGYVLLDLTRPWFVLDRGCDFQNGACRDAEVAREFTALVARARQELETVYDRDGFLILRRPQAAVPAQPPAETPTAPPAKAPSTSPPAGDTPQAPTAPGQDAAASAVQAPAAPPAPNAGGDIEVEVLDRFPGQRHGTKPMPMVAPPSVGQPGQPGQPAGAGPAVAPETAPQENEAPARPASQSRRSRRHRPPAEQSAPPAAPVPDAAVPGSETTIAPAGDAAPAPETQPRPSRRSRRHRAPAPVSPPGPAEPAAGDQTPSP
ncbi:Protein of unknown function DUF2079, membrane [Solidesulfovibrio carbinoliphilus subsp. oakridgensis]|uniref:DUF2079 domain-containing protein n=1 Tax=Solidesulfovibrio carbinoliphilus subsp. oakridgensis TaxID=694327 RepID=G7Q848_9BACT|nr:DUF2079 domain-containing protein [Solidesulfovibrio carbinoliphilus]EHJ48062.1 Protein of unknown function DUF2079, membrane [Solidesulfovibrio carbinoliphilus subsp. oakridgensis]